MACEVNSVPLSLTIMPGLPLRSMSAVSSLATRWPEIEVSGMAARHSWVTSSTMLRILNRRPLAIWSWTKSSDQRAFGLRFHEQGSPDANGPLAALALAHPQPFLPVEPVDAVDARRLALPPQQDEQPAVAEPPALIGKVSQPLPELRLRRPP